MIDYRIFFQNHYSLTFPIFIGTIVVVAAIDFTLRMLLKRDKNRRHQRNLKLIKNIEIPFNLLIIITALYVAIDLLAIFKPYKNVIVNAFFVAYVLIITFLASRIAVFLTSHWLKVSKKYERTPQLLNKIITISFNIIALLVILEYFNVQITAIIATLGLGSIAVGLALQSTLANFISGLHIISDQPIKVGDFVELDIEKNISGYVQDIGWRSTKIKMLPEKLIIIPNAKLAESVIINNSLPNIETVVVVECGVSYKSDLEKVEKITLEVAKMIQANCEGAVRDFEPVVRFHRFGDSNINFKAILRSETQSDKFLVQSEFIKSLKKAFDKEKVEISWPVRKVHYEKAPN